MEFMEYMIFVCAAFVGMATVIGLPVYICEKTGLDTKVINFMTKLFSED